MQSDVTRRGLFLGAGASYELGMPLAWDLTKEIQNWLSPAKLRSLNERWKVQGTGIDDAVIGDFEPVLASLETHYEAKLGYLQTQFSRVRDLAQPYHGLYSWLVELVYMILYFRHVQNVSYIEQGLRYYSGLAGLADAHRPLWVFSLNHDVLTECIAAEHGISVNSGFGGRSSLPLRSDDGSIMGQLAVETKAISDVERSGFDFAAPGAHAINLLKLHGALDVFTVNDGNVLVKLLPQERSARGIVAALKSAHENLFYPINGVRAKAINEIAYADANGEMQFLRRSLLAGAYKFDRRMTQVIPKVMLDQFAANLNYVTELICIGYGFGDNHVNDVLRHWLEFWAQRRLVIVSPAASGVPSFLMHVAPQVECEAATATEYLERFASRPLTRSERAARLLLRGVREVGRQAKGFA